MQNLTIFHLIKKQLLIATGILALIIGCPSTFAAQQPIALQSVHLNNASTDQPQIALQFSAPLAYTPKPFTIDEPAQIVIDFPAVQNKLSKLSEHIGKNGINDIQVFSTANRTRVIIGLQQSLPYKLQTQGNKTFITFTASTELAATNLANQITRLDFQSTANTGGEISIQLAKIGSLIELHKQENQLVALFHKTEVPNNLQRTLDVAAYRTPVKRIKLTQADRQAQLIIDNSADFTYNAYQVDKRYVINIQSATSTANANSIKSFGGQRLSLNFQDIKVRAVLQLLAEFTGINIVASDSVQGNMTLQLNNIPWDQALDIILQTRGLAKRQVGNVIMVAPVEEFANHERKELAAKQELNDLEPLQSELVQVNYGKAQDIAELLKAKGNSLLSSRGNVSFDSRTNTIWVQDTATKLAEIRRLVKQLDIPVKQVLIEARIVNITRDFEQSLGVRFGITNPDHVSGSLEGANSIASGATKPELTSLKDRLNFDLKAPSLNNGQSSPATIGLALAKLGSNVLLDLELSALESEGVAEVISTPRVITANQMTAKIETGEEIPYQESTSSGATSVSFRKAVLGLNVTPQITPDGRIILGLKVNQDKRSTDSPVGGQPAIDTNNIETQVLVENGQTVVLGGVYTQEKNNTILRVPFLGKLPIIGALFRNKLVQDKKTELLIFVTPKIIKQTETNV